MYQYLCTADDMYKYVFVGVKIISFRVKYRKDIRSEKSFVEINWYNNSVSNSRSRSESNTSQI